MPKCSTCISNMVDVQRLVSRLSVTVIYCALILFTTQLESIYNNMLAKSVSIRPQKVNYMFLRHRPHQLQPSASKIFIAFPVFTLKNLLYIANCQFRSAVICLHFVC